MTIKIGCQTYTWQMSYEKYADSLPQIIDTIAKAGFVGIEPEICMLGPYRSAPEKLKRDLESRNLQLAALTLALPWNDGKETEEERAEAQFAIEYLKHFPETLLVLVNLPGKDRSDLYTRQKNALFCINAVAKRASEQGITCAFHPNSPPGSIFRNADDYEVMFAGLDTRYVGYAPDSGHIANGGMNPVEVISKNIDIVKHVHFKDITADYAWTAMGEGVIQHPLIVRNLKRLNYNGWIMVEEESANAEQDPNGVTLQNGRYVQQVLIPLFAQ